MKEFVAVNHMFLTAQEDSCNADSHVFVTVWSLRDQRVKMKMKERLYLKNDITMAFNLAIWKCSFNTTRLREI